MWNDNSSYLTNIGNATLDEGRSKMTRALRTTQIGFMLAGGLPILVYICLRTFPDRGYLWAVPTFHFYMVSIALTLATISSVAIGWIGIRVRDVNVLLMALALQSLSGFFLIHGLSTPGFIIPNAYHLAGVSSQLGVSTCAVWLLLSTVPSDKTIIRLISEYRTWVVFGWLALIAALNATALLWPYLSDSIPVDNHPVNFLIAALTIAMLAWAGQRYFRQYRFARFPMQLSIVYGGIFLSVMQFVMVTTVMWTFAWWLYHLILIISTCVFLSGVVAQYHQSGESVMDTFHQMFSYQPVERIRTGISESMKSLMAATEAKDAYTAGHNFRVAMYAIQLADEMSIEPEKIRALAQGGVVHDVGKIRVPETILNKPALLTPEERQIIELHPVTGYDICKHIGFMKDELDVIRHHHEKWDGTGYPDRLKGQEIPQLARILAVADVYDALTSKRSYREPWPHERALAFIQAESGTHFDPDCVAAWTRLCDSGRLIVESSGHERIS